MSEQYFFVRKLGLGKEVVSLSLVVTEVSRAGGMRWWRQEVGCQISWKKDLERLLHCGICINDCVLVDLGICHSGAIGNNELVVARN